MKETKPPMTPVDLAAIDRALAEHIQQADVSDGVWPYIAVSPAVLAQLVAVARAARQGHGEHGPARCALCTALRGLVDTRAGGEADG